MNLICILSNHMFTQNRGGEFGGQSRQPVVINRSYDKSILGRGFKAPFDTGSL